MSVQKPPDQSMLFGGIAVGGGPHNRPYGTAAFVENFRVMPGNWLRLRGGHVGRWNSTDGLEFLRIHRVLLTGPYAGSDTHLAVMKYGTDDVRLYPLNLSSFTINQATILEQIHTTNVIKLRTEPTPMADAGQYLVYANGYGTTATYFGGFAAYAVPYLSGYSSDGRIRFWGLAHTFDPASLGTRPSLAFTPGSGGSNYNQVATSVQIWMGLYNQHTGHYSNGFLVGSQSATGGTGTLQVAGCAQVLAPYHDSSEQAELKYVFYASIDGLQTPYLILNATLDGPFTVTYGTNLIDLNISSSTDNGWVLDLTHSIPVNNYPPRAMDCIWYSGGRMFGILASVLAEEAGDARFYPSISASDRNGIVFSDASGSIQTADYLGDPLQSWPPKNFSRCSNGQRPLYGMSDPDKQRSLVFTASCTFSVREQADGIMEWETVSSEHGIYRPEGGPARCVVETQRGIVWLTQRKQLAIYTADGQVKLLSDPDFDSVLSGLFSTVQCMAYVYDPNNQVERVDIHGGYFYNQAHSLSSTNYVLSFDFTTGMYGAIDPYGVSASERLVDSTGRTWHTLGATLLSGGGTCAGLITGEGQPDASFGIRTVDEMFVGSGSQSKTNVEITKAAWHGNWFDYGDPNWRKQIDFVDLIGDGEVATSLGISPLVLKYVQGFRPTSGAVTPAMVKSLEELLEHQYQFKIPQPLNTWWKWIVELTPHSADCGSYYPALAEEGSLNSNMYGCVLQMLVTIANTQSRKH